MSERTVTRVQIAGEEYTIRSDASAEYTRECARYVNETLDEIMVRGSLVEVHKAAILAAMALADQLFKSREQADDLRQRLARESTRLLEEIEAGLAAPDLASAD
ncbi:MAG: cell division protein ZapA [Gemmatimonadota bacterium]|jgi:cell division protein ZapA